MHLVLGTELVYEPDGGIHNQHGGEKGSIGKLVECQGDHHRHKQNVNEGTPKLAN
jgi:hypothetical protein